jgi:hypothetical protein
MSCAPDRLIYDNNVVIVINDGEPHKWREWNGILIHRRRHKYFNNLPSENALRFLHRISIASDIAIFKELYDCSARKA